MGAEPKLHKMKKAAASLMLESVVIFKRRRIIAELDVFDPQLLTASACSFTKFPGANAASGASGSRRCATLRAGGVGCTLRDAGD
jgi:hypothetical protein